MIKKTKKEYEEYLNDLQIESESDKYIMGGKLRMSHALAETYGSCLRKHDPIAFEAGFNEWKRQ